MSATARDWSTGMRKEQIKSFLFFAKQADHVVSFSFITW